MAVLVLSLAVAGLLCDYTVASAQVGGNAADILSGVSVRILELVRSALGYFVTSNVLREPQGGDIVRYLADTTQNLVSWLAQLSSLLTGQV